MKSTLILSGLLAAVAVAQPHHGHHNNNLRRSVHARAAAHKHQNYHANNNKRAIHTEWVTETTWVTTTTYIDATKTVYVDDAEPTEVDDEEEEQKQTQDAQFYEAPSPTPAPAPAPEPEPEPEPEVQQEEPVVVQEQPAPPPPVQEPAPEPEPVVVNDPAPPAQEISPAANDVSSVSSSQTLHGEMTYFTVGLGACGFDDGGKDRTDYIVAMNAIVMGPLSNSNPICGKKVRINYNGNSIVAEIRDKCPECKAGDLDVSEAAFIALCGSMTKGRVNISWSWV